MKKIHILILSAIIIIILGGCNSVNEVNNNITDKQVTQNNDNEIKETEQKETYDESDNNSYIDDKENRDSIDNNIEVTSCSNSNDDNYAIQIDRNLTGIELIKSVKIVHLVDTIAYDFTSSTGSYQANGTVVKYGGNYKQVLEASEAGQEGKIITIHNDKEKMNYQCYEATMTGYMYSDAQSGYGPSIDGEYNIAALYDEESNIIDAKVIDYQGEPVLYFKMVESKNYIDSWISLKYGIMIKYQISNDDKIISSFTISNITIPTGIDDSYFLPPSNVHFEDYSK